jgi:hypothetical protein
MKRDFMVNFRSPQFAVVRSWALALGVGLGAICALQAPVAWGDEKVEPLIELSRPGSKGGPPSPKSIERAYSSCLKGVDAEFAAIKAGSAVRKEARKAEEDLCHRSRKDCVADPGGAECRGFVVDYSE